jgi:TusA-related sulfurtransferase
LKASGLACVNITPAIINAISKMQKREVLEVSNDNPASRTSVPAWHSETLVAIPLTAKKGGETAATLNSALNRSIHLFQTLANRKE